MKLFDFDNTIYDGESTVDFFMFVLNKKREITRYIPLMVYSLLMYKANLLSLSKVQEIANKCTHVLVKHQNEAMQLVDEFWKNYSYKLKNSFLSKIGSDDVIITASPNVLIQGIQDQLGTSNIICSTINMEKGTLDFLCMGENKVKAFLKKYPNVIPDEFYTDSMMDAPLMSLAKKCFLVKGTRVSLISNADKKEKNRKKRF